MKCPYCGKNITLRINPIILNEYRTRENQLLFYCNKCQKYYINKIQKEYETKIAFFVMFLILFVTLAFMLKLNSFWPLLIFGGGIILLPDVLIILKLFVPGCVLECDKNYCPIINKPCFRICIPQSEFKKDIENGQLCTGNIIVKDMLIPVVITKIQINEQNYLFDFYCPNFFSSLEGEYGYITINKYKIRENNKYIINKIDEL